MLLKPSCSCCKDYEQFEENKQLQILIDCYRNLCECVSVCVTTEPSASGAKGYPEVMKMVGEVLGVNQEQEDLSPVKDTLDVPNLKIETDSSQNSTDVDLTDSDKPSEQIPTELETPESVTADGSQESDSELHIGTVNVKCKVSQETSAQSVQLSAESASDQEDLKPDITSKEVSWGHAKSTPEPCQNSLQSQTSGALTPGHPPQPQTGLTCLTTLHRKVRLSRKRSRSESDSEMLKPLPITSLIQGPLVAATAPPKTAFQPKTPSPPTVTNGGVLKVNKAVLDSTKNIQINTDLGNKKVQAKSKVAVPKAKTKAKDRMLSASVLAGQPVQPPKVVYKKTQEKKGCKCGRATQNPSVLTCRGQRCPCYSNRKACLDCICRGCQNSYMANGEKKLEAFAVPEKALEQTRLTLGINLTSISVRNASTNAAGVLSLSAGSPMASFLTSSTDEDQSFEDALEMHFDC